MVCSIKIRGASNLYCITDSLIKPMFESGLDHDLGGQIGLYYALEVWTDLLGSDTLVPQ